MRGEGSGWLREKEEVVETTGGREECRSAPNHSDRCSGVTCTREAGRCASNSSAPLLSATCSCSESTDGSKEVPLSSSSGSNRQPTANLSIPSMGFHSSPLACLWKATPFRISSGSRHRRMDPQFNRPSCFCLCLASDGDGKEMINHVNDNSNQCVIFVFFNFQCDFFLKKNFD